MGLKVGKVILEYQDGESYEGHYVDLFEGWVARSRIIDMQPAYMRTNRIDGGYIQLEDPWIFNRPG